MFISRRLACCNWLSIVITTSIIIILPHPVNCQIVNDADDFIAILGQSTHDYEKSCQVEVNEPGLMIQWLRDDTVIQSAEPNIENRGALFIDNSLMTLQDAGHYECRIQWGNGTVSDSIRAGELIVLEASAIVAPPIQYAILYTTVTVECSITNVVVNTRLMLGSNPVIDGNVIEDIYFDEEGMYVCRLSHPDNIMLPVEVTIDLKITVLPEIILDSLPTLYTFTGDNFQNISIPYNGRDDDTTTVTWSKDGQLLPISNTKIMNEYNNDMDAITTLFFTSSYIPRSYSGQYDVIITNSNDIIPEDQRTDSHTFQITITVVPAVIKILSYMPMDLQLARISWEVDYRYDDERPDTTVMSVEVTSTNEVMEYELDLLVVEKESYYDVPVVPGLEYEVIMMSMNHDGSSSSLPFIFMTEYAAPLIDVTTVSRIKEDAFTITTQLYYTGGGIITQFTVSFRIQGEVEWNSATVVPAKLVPESDGLTWTGTVTSSEFAVFSVVEFQVLVENEQSLITEYDGTPLTETQVMPNPPVDIKVASITQTSAVLDVVLSDIGTPPLIVILELTSHPELMCCANMTTFIPGDTVRFSLEGLRQDTTYTVKAYATNMAGKGIDRQHSFSTDGATTTLALWQIVLIGVCGALVLGVLVVLFCVLLCCGCKASKKWGRKEYHTGPIEVASKELDRNNPMLTRSIRSNGYASSQVSFGSHHVPMTPRTPTGLSVTSPAFEYIDAPKYDDIQRPNRFSTSVSPFRASSRDQLTGMASASHGNLFSPNYQDSFPDEMAYQSLPRGGGDTTANSFFSNSPSTTLSPPPAPKAFATDV